MRKCIKNILTTFLLNFISFIRKIKVRCELKNEQIEHLKKQIFCNKKWYGSSYGGFYINHTLLNKKSIIYSFGIGKDITFDLACIKKHECNVFGFDPTPKSINWIKSIKTPAQFHFFDFGLATQTGSQIFYLPAHPRGTSGSLKKSTAVSETNSINVPMKSLKDIKQELGHNYVDVIKMDIEGSEYEILDAWLDSGLECTQLLIEFHDRLYSEKEPKSLSIVEKLNKNGFVLFAHSFNYEEISFIKQSP